MKPMGRSRSWLVIIASVLVAAVAFFSIQRLRQASANQVSVEFEGPSAFVPDPQNARDILAIAPNTKSHRPLTVANSSLAAGIYELSFPAHDAKAPIIFGI